MRYIGNKTKLLGFIRSVLKRRGIRAGVAVDPSPEQQAWHAS